MKDGIVCDNKILRKVEPLVTVKQLRSRFLFGVDIIDNNGKELPDEVLQEYIDMAVSMLEHDLDMSITPQTVTEQKDYYANDYYEWGYFQLNNVPVIDLNSVKVVYLEDESGQDQTVLDIPRSWWRIKEHDGILRLVPNNRFPAGLQVNSGGAFFPELFNRHSQVPNLWRITYKTGFEDGKIPMALNAAVGYIASIQALHIGGDLVLGAGIASSSLSIDGLSQSINSTSSAENHAYSAKAKEYQKILFGDGINSPNRGLIRTLRDFYQGSRFNII